MGGREFKSHSGQTFFQNMYSIYIIIYVYTKIIVWCEDEERSIPLQVERKVKVNTQVKDQLLLLRVSRQLAIFRQLTYQIYYKRIYKQR